MLARSSDLILIVACTLALVPIILIVPWASPVRIALGLPFVLFFPGYTLIAALFPKKGDLEPVERIALSFGLSLAIVPLIGLGLNYSPWGIRLQPILASLAFFIVTAASIAAHRRWTLPLEEAFVIPLNAMLLNWRHASLTDQVLTAAIALAVAGLGMAIYIAATRGNGEKFTEFYILGSDGKAEDYPTEVFVGERVKLQVGVINHEGEKVNYRIEVRANGRLVSTLGPLELADEEKWERLISFTLPEEGERQKVEFLLYKGPGGEPYRKVHLWMDVKAPAAAPPSTPAPEVRATPPPMPRPTPALTPMPALRAGFPRLRMSPDGPVYIVQPGDTLIGLAARFGLSIEVILKANGLNEAGPLKAGQELLIPGVTYTVQPGDTLAGIAAAFNTPLTAIMAANGIADPNSIYWGQALIIPKAPP